MNAHSQAWSDTETDVPKEITAQKVLNLYGFLLFILTSSVLYFLMLNLYFVSDFGRKVVFGMMGAIALFSLCMVFYLQINPAAH